MSARLTKKQRRAHFAVAGYLHCMGPSFALDIAQGTALSPATVYAALAGLVMHEEVERLEAGSPSRAKYSLTRP